MTASVSWSRAATAQALGSKPAPRHKKNPPARLTEELADKPVYIVVTVGDAGVPSGVRESSQSSPSRRTRSSTRRSREAAALQRQTVMKEQYTAKLDQTPQAILGAVIRHERERVVSDAELDDFVPSPHCLCEWNRTPSAGCRPALAPPPSEALPSRGSSPGIGVAMPSASRRTR